jgi:hypothetical protein
VGQKGGHTYVWAEIGSRPEMVRDNRHDSVYLFGAICPARGIGATIIMPAANAEAMNEHLKEIAAQVTPGAHAVVVLDGAGWHRTGRRLKVPDNLTLLGLPAYSPELNPVESSCSAMQCQGRFSRRRPTFVYGTWGYTSWGWIPPRFGRP